MSVKYDNSKNVCKLCNLKTMAVFNKNNKKYEDIHVSKLKGTVEWNGYLFCNYCWCKKHNGPKPTSDKKCLTCYPKNLKLEMRFF